MKYQNDFAKGGREPSREEEMPQMVNASDGRK